jgi:hypothetical protein
MIMPSRGHWFRLVFDNLETVEVSIVQEGPESQGPPPANFLSGIWVKRGVADVGAVPLFEMRSGGVCEISVLHLARLPKAHALATLPCSFQFRQLHAITGVGGQGCQTLRNFDFPRATVRSTRGVKS